MSGIAKAVTELIYSNLFFVWIRIAVASFSYVRNPAGAYMCFYFHFRVSFLYQCLIRKVPSWLFFIKIITLTNTLYLLSNLRYFATVERWDHNNCRLDTHVCRQPADQFATSTTGITFIFIRCFGNSDIQTDTAVFIKQIFII